MGKRLVVEDSFWQVFPDVEIGVLCVDGIRPTDQIGDDEAKAAAKFLDRANASAEEWLTSTTISKNEVVAVWRDAYRKFKTKKGARCSIENLLKRVLKGNPVGSITPSVDLYNAISLKYALPVGGEDIDTFVGDFRLGITEGGDAFLPIGEDANDPTLPGELCYRDDQGAVCRCFNWRDGQRTALTDDSINAILVMECLDPARRDALEAALDEFAQLMERYLGATVQKRTIVDREHPEVPLVG